MAHAHHTKNRDHIKTKIQKKTNLKKNENQNEYQNSILTDDEEFDELNEFSKSQCFEFKLSH